MNLSILIINPENDFAYGYTLGQIYERNKKYKWSADIFWNASLSWIDHDYVGIDTLI